MYHTVLTDTFVFLRSNATVGPTANEIYVI